MTINRENLEKLASYLENLPEDYQHFGMRSYLNPTDLSALIKYAEQNGGVHTCGTAACAVGHGPAAGILFPEANRYSPFWRGSNGHYIYDEEGNIKWSAKRTLVPNWFHYSACMFFNSEPLSRASTIAWHWCFGSEWGQCDNTPKGAAARIRYLLRHGRPPVGFDTVSSCKDFVECYS